ncbi:peptidoglycan-binding domain-containing protein [Salinarimonas sp.]|uniref:peptidoglycan-binding domain-containing protein n=1 Tax=Salinarimonas sp. TaxID=2766526 RepID=UPI0032D99451
MKLRSTLAAVMLLGSVQVALAQADVLFGIMGLAIQEGMRQQQLERQRQIDQQAVNRQREHEIRQVRRVQTALKTLGFYTLRVDGDAGPGTRAALDRYFNAFGMAPKALLEADIVALEQRAAAGFRSAAEERAAHARGFSTRQDMEIAERAGFRDASALSEARRVGARDADELASFRSSGFPDMAAFRRASEAGFRDHATWEAARRAGFTRFDEWVAFEKSGLETREAFLRERERAAEREAGVQACRAAVAARDWMETARACRRAATLAPDDVESRAALSTAARQLDALVVASGAELARLEGDLEAMRRDVLTDAQAASALEAMVDRVAQAEAAHTRARAAHGATLCLQASAEERWQEAADLCAEALAREPGGADLRLALSEARDAVTAQRRAIEAERRRIARETFLRESEALVGRIESFTAGGGAFENGLDVAAALIDLRAAMDDGAPDGIEAARAVLDDLLASERAFGMHVEALERAEQEADAAAFAQARRNAERLDGFVRAWVARNVTAPQARDLLALGRVLSEALAGADPDAVVAAQKEATATLASLGLGEEAAAFRLEPEIDASALEERDRAARAASERARLAMETARTEAEARIARVDRYAREANGAFEDALGVARAVLALKAALSRTEAEAIVQAIAALDDALDGEERFRSFEREADVAERGADAAAFAQARDNAERLEAFARAQVARDVLAPGVPDLLEIQESLSRALSGADPDAIVAAQADAVDRIAKLGLESAAAAFVLRPEVEAAALLERQAQSEAARFALDRARARTDDLFATVDAFVEGGGRFMDGLAVARGVAGLRRARDGADAAPVEAAVAELERLLDAEEAYVAFAERRAGAMAASETDAAASAAEIAATLDGFLRDHLAANPLGEEAPALLELQAGLNAALESRHAPTLAAALDTTREGLRSLALWDEAELFLARLTAGEAQVETAPNGLAVTALNRALLVGDPRDVLVLRNLSGSAPNLRADLLGALVFEGGRTRACWRHDPPDQTLGVRSALARIRALGGRAEAAARCPPEAPGAQDLVLVERGALLGESLAYARPVVRALEEGRLEVLDAVLWSSVAARAAEGERLARDIEAEVSAGVRAGFGFLAAGAPGGDRVCVVETAPARDAAARESESALHEAVLSARAEDLALHAGPIGPRLVAEPDAVFARLQRGECALVLARAEELARLLDALAREETPHRVLPIWLEADEISALRGRLAAERAEALQLLGARRQEQEAAAVLADAQRARADRARQAAQEALRSTHGQTARAAQNDMAAGVETVLGGKPSAAMADLFPRFVDWVGSRPLEFWEVDGHDVRLLDYGVATWDGRPLEAVVVVVTVETRNAEFGRYEAGCFLLGWLLDREFDRRRDGFEASCEGPAPTERWPGFESRWIAASPDG